MVIPSVAVDRSLLESIFVNVDLPDDFGPQTIMAGVFRGFNADNLDSTSFHSGGDKRGCKETFCGPSLEENS